MTENSFWTNFLRPLKDRDSPGKYEAGFKKRPPTKPELILKKNENEDSRCLSRMILGQLRVQTEQTENRKKRKVIAYDQQLGGLIRADESDSQFRESSQSAHRDVTRSTSIVRYGDSATAKNKAISKTTIQRGLYKYGFKKVSDGGDITSAINRENQEMLNQRQLHKQNFDEANDSGNIPTGMNQTNHEIMKEREFNKQDFKEFSNSGNIPSAMNQTNHEINNEREFNRQNFKDFSDSGNIPTGMNQTNHDEIMNGGEINKRDLKRVSMPIIIDLTDEEISINTYSAEEHETKRFKNAVANSAKQSDIIDDRTTEYPDNDEDTEGESRLDPILEESVRKATGIFKAKDKIEKQKSHQQCSVSKWNLEDLELYVKREQVNLVKTLDVSNVKVEQFDRDRFSDLQTSLVHRSRQVLDYWQCFDKAERRLKLWSLQFSKPELKEITVSFIVFEVLYAVCQRCDVRLKPEVALPKINGYPYARVDYALAYKDVMFGVVEIKTPQEMKPKALAQLLLPLLKLQQQSCQEKMQYVGILTDGFRYVLVRLEGEKFTFEYDGSTENPKLHIRRAVKWNDLYALCDDIQSVFKSATARLEELTNKRMN